MCSVTKPSYIPDDIFGPNPDDWTTPAIAWSSDPTIGAPEVGELVEYDDSWAGSCDVVDGGGSFVEQGASFFKNSISALTSLQVRRRC